MQRPGPSDRPETLLAHAAWLRGFARALVRDEAAAEDLAQDALGVALAAAGPVRAPRAFLAGAARRLAARTRRAEARRQRRERERETGSASAAPAADALAERVDTLRVVLEELRRLPAAQQQALTLRYLEELDPAEIARRQGTRAATVRAHLARGLAELRARLDRRLGGREAWCAVLAPWAWPPGPSSLPAAPPAPAAAGPALTAGAAVMSIKLVAALVPLAALGVWWALREPAAPADAGVARVERPAPDAPEAPRAAGPAASAAPAGRRPLDAARAPAGAAAAHEVPAPTPTRVAVVDRSTGEPVPHLDLTLRDARGRERALRTDADGALTVDPPLPPGDVTVLERDDHGGWFTPPRATTVQAPLEGPLEVLVGPTFTLLLELPEGLAPEALRATFVERPQRREVAHEARLRAGALPWVRFPHAVCLLAGDGPWGLRVVDDRGLWRGEAQVARKQGIDRLPVVLDLERTGAIAFRVSGLAGDAATPLAIEVEDASGAPAARVLLARDESGAALTGRAGHLAPGDYAWSFGIGGDAQRERVRVVAGEVLEVEVEAARIGPTFDAEVRIDATAAPEVDLSGAMVMVVRVDDPANGLVTAAVRDERGEPGSWRIPLAGLPDGRWHVVVGELPGYAWDPSSVVVAPGGGAPRLALTPLGPSVAVRVRAVDAATGARLAGLEAAHTLDGFNYTFMNPAAEGQLLRAHVPRARESRFVVRAAGYRARLVAHQPARDGEQLEVALERGWSNRVVVLGADDLRPVAGIPVRADGVERGRTGADGTLALAGERPPARVELAAEDASLEVVLSPEALPDASADPLIGYLFLVRGR